VVANPKLAGISRPSIQDALRVNGRLDEGWFIFYNGSRLDNPRVVGIEGRYVIVHDSPAHIAPNKIDLANRQWIIAPPD
jgi:hypothetical protein